MRAKFGIWAKASGESWSFLQALQIDADEMRLLYFGAFGDELGVGDG